MRYAQSLHAVFTSNLQHVISDEWVHVKVLMRVDVIERQSGLAEELELGCDLTPQLTTYARAQRDIASQSHHVRPKHPLAVDQVGNVVR